MRKVTLLKLLDDHHRLEILLKNVSSVLTAVN